MELLRDRSAEFEEAGVRAVGISRDSPWTHIAWMQALDLNFPLLSDWNAEARARLRRRARVPRLRGRGRAHGVPRRPSGTVRGAWRYETAEVPDFDVLLAAAPAL